MKLKITIKSDTEASMTETLRAILDLLELGHRSGTATSGENGFKFKLTEVEEQGVEEDE